jgi:hypothetical protein
MPRGYIDVNRQLDALAHVIANDDINAVAAKWGITPNGVYQLARSALKRFRRATHHSRRPTRRVTGRRTPRLLHARTKGRRVIVSRKPTQRRKLRIRNAA